MRPRPSPRSGPVASRLTLALVLIATGGWAGVVRVPADAASIGQALAGAQPGDTILVACGTYAEGNLSVPSGVTVRSEDGDPDCVTIDADGATPAFVLEGTGPTTLLEGLTIRNGATATNGGGVVCLGGAPTLRRCRFLNCRAEGDGGALYLFESAPLVEECELIGNTSAGGSGGAVTSRQSNAVLRHCIMSGNAAAGWGGAVYASGPNAPRLDKCEVTANRAYYGGGLAANGAAMVLDRVMIRDNRATDLGGGVYLAFGANLDAAWCEWSGNAAPTGKDVLVQGGCSASFNCCRLDPSTVAGGGTVVFHHIGCEVGNSLLRWGTLKSRYIMRISQ